MTDLILIKGSTDSHKSSSARLFARNYCTNFTNIFKNPNNTSNNLNQIPSSGDFIAIGTCLKNGVNLNIGIGSAGDNQYYVQGNLRFFSNHHLDVIVICSKSSGSSLDEVTNNIYQASGLYYNRKLSVTSTIKYPPSSNLISVDTARVARDVFTLI